MERALWMRLSSWGAKNPIKMAVLKENKTFRTAEQIREFLASVFSNDDTKRYVIEGDTILSSLMEERTNVPSTEFHRNECCRFLMMDPFMQKEPCVHVGLVTKGNWICAKVNQEN